ncbi:hypothetical protein [Erwinia sp. V71]
MIRRVCAGMVLSKRAGAAQPEGAFLTRRKPANGVVVLTETTCFIVQVVI